MGLLTCSLLWALLLASSLALNLSSSDPEERFRTEDKQDEVHIFF